MPLLSPNQQCQLTEGKQNNTIWCCVCFTGQLHSPTRIQHCIKPTFDAATAITTIHTQAILMAMLVICPLSFVFHLLLDYASSTDRPKLNSSSLTESHQVFHGRPLGFVPSTSIVIPLPLSSLSVFILCAERASCLQKNPAPRIPKRSSLEDLWWHGLTCSSLWKIDRLSKSQNLAVVFYLHILLMPLQVRWDPQRFQDC